MRYTIKLARNEFSKLNTSTFPSVLLSMVVARLRTAQSVEWTAEKRQKSWLWYAIWCRKAISFRALGKLLIESTTVLCRIKQCGDFRVFCSHRSSLTADSVRDVVSDQISLTSFVVECLRHFLSARSTSSCRLLTDCLATTFILFIHIPFFILRFFFSHNKNSFRFSFSLVLFHRSIVLGNHLRWTWNRRYRRIPWRLGPPVGAHQCLLQWGIGRQVRSTCSLGRLGTRHHGLGALGTFRSNFPSR